jgi:Tfp pilus assembly protein PilO
MLPADFLRQLWSGHRVLVSAVALLLLANLVAGLTLQQYLVPTVNEREQQVIRRQSELRSGGDSPAQLFVQGEKDLVAFRDKIPLHREFTGLIVELQTLAEDAGLDLNQVSYKAEQEKGSGLLRYTLTFTVVGSYRDIKQFVHALEQSSRLIILRKIGLQGAGEDGATDVRLQLSLETFFRAGVP